MAATVELDPNLEWYRSAGVRGSVVGVREFGFRGFGAAVRRLMSSARTSSGLRCRVSGVRFRGSGFRVEGGRWRVGG
jgi:hypothetical protein